MKHIYTIFFILTFCLSNTINSMEGYLNPKVGKWKGFEEKEIIEEYTAQKRPQPGIFEVLPADVIGLIGLHTASANTLDEAAYNIKTFLITDRRLSGFLTSPIYTKPLLEYLALRFKNNTSQESVIDAAVALGTKGARNWLLKKSNSIDWQRNPHFINKVIQKIPMSGYREIAENLIKAGVNVNTKNENGNTPIIQAIKDRNISAALTLLDSPTINVLIKNNQNEDARMLTEQDLKMAKNRAATQTDPEAVENAQKWQKLHQRIAMSPFETMEYTGRP